jgi:hypothetical protein
MHVVPRVRERAGRPLERALASAANASVREA